MNTNTAANIASIIMRDGLEALSDEQREYVNEQPTLVAELLPRPLGVALYQVLEQPVPIDYVGLPARTAKAAIRAA